ncbi:MAG: preprotein translocase subunit SecE [Chlamydiia bacterium]|nr:preprotein translocase subunit SecE [Chlamydiia bacterium]
MQQQMSVRMKEKKESSQPMTPKIGLMDLFGELKAEFQRIAWTERHEVRQYVKVVVASTMVAGVCIYLVDVGINLCLRGLNGILSLIGG